MNIPRADHKSLRVALALCVPALFAARASMAAEAADATDRFQFFVMDRYLYDDNLFRVPDYFFENHPTLVAPQSLDDYVNRASAGVRVRLDQSRQTLHADLRIDDVRYQRNDNLDYTGGSADLLWNWQLASEWSGRLFGTFDRAQASLANYSFFSSDIVDTAMYGGEVRYGFGGRWRLLAAAVGMDTDHSAELRSIENYESTTGRGGVEYVTPAGTVFALEYRATDASLPVAESLTGMAQGYKESEPGIRIEYTYSVKTRFSTHFGYLKRDYDSPAAGEYSGVAWDGSMQWEPTGKLNFDIEAWHKLKAYPDSAAKYYLADGVSITPEWEVTHLVTIAGVVSYEKQDYTGTDFVLLPGESERKDDVWATQFSIDYKPRKFFSVGFAYRWTERSSNRADFRGYYDNIASAQIKLTF
ncbi:MAG TPA: outer membrane beta-barrel protein [Povalibacter sp.]